MSLVISATFLSYTSKLLLANDLGINIDPTSKTGLITMAQSGLIDEITSDLRFDKTSMKKYTAASSILHPDPDGQDRKEEAKCHY
eukprot:scaffold41985_cov49-Attheya_sp.AAC.1